jgi:Tfp pilus assembly protein PilV
MKNNYSDSGIALILVMLALLVLSLLAAAMVLTGRSESLASYSFRLDTEADYVAKAGIQNAVNWLRSNHYAAVSQTQMQATLYYNVTAEPKYGLYSANSTPIQCVATSPSCPSTNSNVQLIGYGSLSSNYPNISNSLGAAVSTQFAQDLNNNGHGVSVAGDSNHAGLFWVNMYLLNYQTVNCSSCNSNAMETWLITSKGVWTGGSTQTTGIASAEEQAVVQPVYYPTFGNAMYGYCSVSMSGSSGTCTDAFNSALGPYCDSCSNKTISGACGQNVTNVIASDSNIGANGFVSIGSNPVVFGNVVIGDASPGLIPSSCCSGNSCGGPSSGNNIKGSIITGAPFAPAPPVPTFPSGFPGSAPSYSSAVTLPVTSGSNPPVTPGSGSKSSPYLISSISSNTDTFTFNGGPNIANPVYFDIGSVSLGGSNGAIAVNGFVVFNVQTTLDLGGNGVYNSSLSNNPPEAVQINFAGTVVSIHGNGGMSATLTAPLATVTLGGGGSKGYFVGSIRALNVSAQGGYPMHYDVQLQRLDGVMGQMIVSSYARIKQ